MKANKATHGFRCRAKQLEDDGVPVILGATAWALARDDAAGRFDYLFVDEAGQVPAANLAAMASCAARVVLFGDQMQLPAPKRGAHGSEDGGASCLEYYCGPGSVAADRGVRRISSSLCAA